jgi:beta-glucanase (GH16 family)
MAMAISGKLTCRSMWTSGLFTRGVLGLVGLLMFHQSVTAAPPGVGGLVWSDEFSGTSLDATKWAVNAPGVWGDAVNSTQAASVGGGSLKITTYTDPGTGKHYAAVIGTQDRYLATYGYFESRIQFNSSPGMWSAYWLMSPTVGNPMGDPATAGTEIDVVEHRATNDVGDDRTDRIHTALHWDGYGLGEQTVQYLSDRITGLANGTWHTYGLRWAPDGYTFYMDDSPVWSQAVAVSHRSEYLLLSSEVENNSWAGVIPAGGYGSPSASTTNMLVDYVRVYAVPEPTTLLALGLALLVTARRRAPQ